MITRKCAVSGQDFIIEDEDLDFYAKMGVITEEERDNLKSKKIPEKSIIGLPTLCPEERQKRRLAWRNERKLYKRKCDATGKDIISIYHQDVPFPVYDQKYWWSDKWDGLDYGQVFDFSRPFFEQFNELREKVPRVAIYLKNCENCDFSNHIADSKNCYLSMDTVGEKIYYSNWVFQNSTFITDSYHVYSSELCYECQVIESCYNCYFVWNSKNCSDSWFLNNCISCKNCFGCTNLRHKEYYFLNEKMSKNSYEKKLKDLQLGRIDSLKKLKKSFLKYVEKFPQKIGNIIHSENAIGDLITESKNTIFCFNSTKSEDLKYCYDVFEVKDSMDVYQTAFSSELLYEQHACNKNFDCMVCSGSYENRDIAYCDLNHNTEKLFGCVGLKRQKYCILNKQYTKEEYEELVPKIIAHMKRTGEWGEFFPISMSPFAYNETVAQEYFPLTKEEALKKGYKWKDEEPIDTKKSQEFFWDSIPDDIKDVSDDILNTVLYCERTQKPFKIQKAELAFYRKMNLPIPHLHPDERHKDRMKLRNPRKLWTRKCADCQCEIQTTFDPERPEKVLCEECYLKVVQ